MIDQIRIGLVTISLLGLMGFGLVVFFAAIIDGLKTVFKGIKWAYKKFRK